MTPAEPDLAARLAEMETQLRELRKELRDTIDVDATLRQMGKWMNAHGVEVTDLLADARRELDAARAEIAQREEQRLLEYEFEKIDAKCLKDRGIRHEPKTTYTMSACKAYDALRAERSQLTETIAADMAIIDRLRAENAELRAALEGVLQVRRHDVDCTCQISGSKCNCWRGDVRSLLAAKPAPVAGE